MSNFDENSREIKDKASDLYNAAKENMAEAYIKTKPEAQELASKIGETATDLYSEGKTKFLNTESSIENALRASIRQQPLISILIAAGIGFLYGKLRK